jgi:1,2-dihydroxy-3-keto-5-methylthiopentene dioxygenase
LHVFNSEFEFHQLNPDDPVQDEKLEKIKRDRHYTYEDQLTCSKECLPNFEEKVLVVQTASVV